MRQPIEILEKSIGLTIPINYDYTSTDLVTIMLQAYGDAWVKSLLATRTTPEPMLKWLTRANASFLAKVLLQLNVNGIDKLVFRDAIVEMNLKMSEAIVHAYLELN